MSTLAGVVLLVVGLVAFQQARDGTLGPWLKAKFFNAADPLRPGNVGGDFAPGGSFGGGDFGAPPEGQGVSAGGWVRPSSAPTISPFGVPRPNGRTHQGVDIGGAAYKGTACGAVRAGTVVRAGSAGGRCGLRVAVDHGDGYESIYCHLDRVDVRRGDRVSAGQRVGTIGNTGNARRTPAHVHLEVHLRDRVIDPATVIPASVGGIAA